ncbi:MAG: hypothetical protein ACKV2U_17275 [Bryobacteraceae bacterium]
MFRRYLTGFTLEGKIDADRSFFGSFWQEGQTLKYYLVIQFPDSFARELFDGVYVPELMECRLTKLRVLVFSHATMAFQHGWDAGVHFLSDFQFGRNLQRAVSIDNQVFFGGKLTLVEDRINFDLMSWPEFTFTMGGGKIVIENGRVQARVRESVDEELWEDDDANIEGQDADEIPPDDGSPNPLDAQVSLSGRLQAGEAPKLPVWTPLPPDSGAVCWQLNPPPVVCSSNQLATFLGPDWDSRFSLKPVTYDCRSLAITVNLETGRLSDVTCEIAMPTFDINGVCPKTLTIAPAAVTAQANFPFDEEHRTLTIEVEGDTRPSADTAGLALSANYSLLESELTLTVPDESLPDTWKSMYWLRGVGLPDRGYDALSIVWSPTSCRAYLSGDELDLDMEAKK